MGSYSHGGYPKLVDAIARYAGVGPENVVLGAGADDLILLCARAFAGPGDTVAIADEPTYPLFRIGAWLAGAEVGDDDPVLTFCCRPNNPTGALDPLPDTRPLVVDEAYFEFCRETAVNLIDDGVIVIRTFSKAFALAAARVGYAIADADTARELNARQAPCPVSSLSVALALEVTPHPDIVAFAIRVVTLSPHESGTRSGHDLDAGIRRRDVHVDRGARHDGDRTQRGRDNGAHHPLAVLHGFSLGEKLYMPI